MPDGVKQHVDAIDSAVLETIERHLKAIVGPTSAHRTNIWLVKHVVEPGDTIGPPGHEKTAMEHTIVGFIDDHPHANWHHPCRHVHFKASDGVPIETVPARSPPVMRNFRDNHVPVSVPVGAPKPTPLTPAPPAPATCAPAPDQRTRHGNRYAIIFAGGIPNPQHLNDAELCWRLLVEAYGFDPANIQVLNYNGTWELYSGSLHTEPDGQPHWPGDNSHFRMTITGPGTRPGFQAACAALAGHLQPDDLLFLFMGNHGDHDPGAGSSLLVPGDHGPAQPAHYFATDLATDLKTLPKHRALITVMQQCNSGGFVDPILQATTAAQASVAAACKATGLSHHCNDWDPFAVNWIQAAWGPSCPYQPYPSSPSTSSGPTAGHPVNTREAFDYCVARNNAGPPLDICFDQDDGPVLGEHPPGAAIALSLDQQYVAAQART